MQHLTQDMNCSIHADINGNILLTKPEGCEDQVGFLKKSLNVTRFESKRFSRFEGHYLSLAWEETKSKQKTFENQT